MSAFDFKPEVFTADSAALAKRWDAMRETPGSEAFIVPAAGAGRAAVFTGEVKSFAEAEAWFPGGLSGAHIITAEGLSLSAARAGEKFIVTVIDCSKFRKGRGPAPELGAFLSSRAVKNGGFTMFFIEAWAPEPSEFCLNLNAQRPAWRAFAGVERTAE
jgi:hypothetical protein